MIGKTKIENKEKYEKKCKNKIIQDSDFTSIPIIDLTLSKTDPNLFLKKLQYAIINVGFFYIKNHKISEELLTKIKDYTILFFDLPFEEKIKLHMNLSPSFLGYLMAGTETTMEKINNREQYNFSNEINKEWKKGFPEYYKVYGPNLWPNEIILPGFKEIFLEYINVINDLSKDLLCFISESLGLPKYTLCEYINEEYHCRGRIIKYPNINDENDNNQGVGPHKDTTSLLTILLPLDYLPGLQVQNHSGEWINVPKIDNTFIVNLGLPLEHILNGIVSATTHRVINPPFGMGTRYSLPVFITNRFNKSLNPINLPINILNLKSKNVISDVKKYKRQEVLENPGDIFLKRRIRGYPNVAKIHYPDLDKIENKNK